MLDRLIQMLVSVQQSLRQTPSTGWAVVTVLSPLTVKLEGDTAATVGVSTLVSGLAVGNRVLVVTQNHQVTVIGKGKGGIPVTDAQLPGRLRGDNLGTGIDANVMKTTGWYSGYGWSNTPNNSGIAVLEVLVYSSDWVIQRFNDISAANTTYQRMYHSGSTWTAWKIIS